MNPAATGPSAPPGAGPTRAAITTITLLISGMCFAFCFGNAHRLCVSLGIEGWIAWLIGPSVDLSVIGLLLGVRHLSSLGYRDAQLTKPRRLLTFCGLLTLALNTADAVTHGQYGTAAVEAIGPILLICWADTGPWLLRQIHTRPAAVHTDAAASAQEVGPQQEAALLPAEKDTAPVEDEQPADFAPAARIDAAPEKAEPDGARSVSGRPEAELWAGALRLDAAHRAEHGRAITRDALREGLNIGTNKATELNRRLREHTAHAARLAVRLDPAQPEQARGEPDRTPSFSLPISGVCMSVNPAPFNPADALAEHLAEHVRAAARALTTAADALTGEPPSRGYTATAVELRALLDAVTEHAITYDLYAGPGLETVAVALGVTERTVRARFGGGPRELPLLIALGED